MLKNLLSNLLYQVKGILTSRLFIVGILAAVMFGTLVMRLFTLQIVEGESYQQEYLQTSTRTVEESYTRGTIFDRNGEKLAYNKLAYVVGVVDDGSYTAYERNARKRSDHKIGRMLAIQRASGGITRRKSGR